MPKLIHHRTFKVVISAYILHPRLFNKLNIKITTITKAIMMIIMRMRIIRKLAVRRELYPVVAVAFKEESRYD